jgi:hypothetical protein
MSDDGINRPQFPQPTFPQPSSFPQPTGQPLGPGQFGAPPAAPPSTPPSAPQGQYGGVPDYASGGPVATAPKKKRKWWKIILGIFVVLLLLIGGCTVVVVKAAKDVVGEGNKFLSALYTGNDAAVKRACPGAEREKIAQLRSQLLEAGWKGAKQLNSFSTEDVNGVSTGAIGGTVTAAKGPHPVSLYIEKNSNWCVKSAQVDFTTIVRGEVNP